VCCRVGVVVGVGGISWLAEWQFSIASYLGVVCLFVILSLFILLASKSGYYAFFVRRVTKLVSSETKI
jgi:hypothetical protein